MLQVAEINEVEQLQSLRLTWRDLWQRTRNATFFQSLDWLECYWKHFGQNQKLRVLIPSLAGRPMGIVPLVVKTAHSSLGEFRVLTYPLDNWGLFYGPIGPNPAATLSAAMRHLQSSTRDWDLIDLRHIDTQGTDRGRTRNAMHGCGLRSRATQWQTRAVVDLTGSWPEFLATRRRSQRDAFRLAEKRLARSGTVKHVRYRPNGTPYGDANPRFDLFRTFDAMPVSSPNGKSHATKFSAARDFLDDVHTAAVRTGSVDLNLLYVDERPVASAYNLHNDGIVQGVSFRLSDADNTDAANVLVARMLEDSIRLGDRSVSSAADGPHAFDGWQTGIATSYRYTHFALTAPRAQMLRLNSFVKTWLGVRKQRNRTASTPVAAATV